MADADRNNLNKSHVREARNERNAAPTQPGASGNFDENLSPEEARRRAEHTYGKTGKNSSGEA